MAIKQAKEKHIQRADKLNSVELKSFFFYNMHKYIIFRTSITLIGEDEA